MSSRWRNAKRNLIETWFSPDREYLFALRIRLRIQILRVKLWWRRPKVTVVRRHLPKPLALIIVGIFVPVIFGWLLSKVFPREANGLFTAFSNLLTDPQRSRLEWREAAQLLLLLIGIPSAFLLWLFRDINVSGTLDNQRKDVNLKEFQEIQMRAAGAMDERLPADARETLQIAALHQIRAFLRGEYGASFRRPAFELLRARFVASAQITGTQAISDWMRDWRTATAGRVPDLLVRISKMRRELKKAVAGLRPSRVAETERLVVNEEWEAVFRSGLPLTGSIFDRIWLPPDVVLAEGRFSSCRFIHAFLGGVHFEKAQLFNADFVQASLYRTHFEGAYLVLAHFEGAQLFGAHLERANLRQAHFEGARLESARLEWADLSQASLAGATLRGASLRAANLAHADLRGADLTHADLAGASLDGALLEGASIAIDPAILSTCQSATFDDATGFAETWSNLSKRQRDAARAPWIERGAVRLPA